MSQITARLSKVKFRLQMSLPLIPVLSGLCFFIAVLSPVAWNDKGAFNISIGALAVAFGIVCAYCIAAFIEECFTRFGGQSK